MTTAAHHVARPRVCVATCAAVPDLDEDGPALLAALERAGAVPAVAVWDDPRVDWDAFDLVLVRSTWDYTPRREDFVRWARRCRRTANPADVLAWNTDKRYLEDLERAGVPVVPTTFLDPGQPYVEPPSPGGDVVIKPTVSASAADTARFPAGGDPRAVALVAALHAQGRTAMVQPYLAKVDADGETALVHLGGRLSHAARKAPLLTAHGTRPPAVGDETAMSPAIATPEQVAVAEAALAAVPGGPGRLSYARVDLVPGDDGRPVLLELELTEPSLFMAFGEPGAVDRLAAAVVTASRDRTP